MHLSRHLVTLCLLHHQISVLDLFDTLLDPCMIKFVDLHANELAVSMLSPVLYSEPDTKKAIKAVLTHAAEVVPEKLSRMSRTWPDQGLPEVPAGTMKQLDKTDLFQSTLGGVVVRYALYGKSVSCRDVQVRACVLVLPRWTKL